MDDKASRHKLPINVVILNRRKVLTRLNQKGKWQGMGVFASPIVDKLPPANR
jgi:hypothetical protein